MRNYIVYPKDMFDDSLKDDELIRIRAINVEEAKLIFSEYFYKHDKSFLEDLYTPTMNMSFAETFFFQTHEESENFCESGKSPIDEDEFKTRVFEWFDGNEKWAALYLDFYLNDHEIRFPDEMVKFIWKKKYMNSEEFNFVDIGKIKVIN